MYVCMCMCVYVCIGSRKRKMVTEKIHGNVKGEREIRKIARARTEFLVQHIQGQNKLVLLLIIVNNIPIID